MSTTTTPIGPKTDARVILTGDGEWRGTLSEFIEANEDMLTPCDIIEISDAFSQGKTWRTGGGAAPDFILQLDPSE